MQLELSALSGATPTAVVQELLATLARALGVPLPALLARTEGLSLRERLQQLLGTEPMAPLLLLVGPRRPAG